MTVSTHVLDAARGRPAAGVEVVLESAGDSAWVEVRHAVTDSDGRVAALGGRLPEGVYRVRFAVEDYLGGETFFPEVVIVFRIRDAAEHHHVPLLLSPYAYSTYRGS
jgi:5-hydroxyisourate hydrolase